VLATERPPHARALDGRVEPGHDEEREGDPNPPVFCKRMGALRRLHHIWWSFSRLRRGKRGRDDDFRENNSKAILSPDQRLKEGLAECWASTPRPNPLPQRGAREQWGDSTQFSEVRMGTFSPGGGGKRGFSQNK
jgi:hypothetical protein